MIYADIIIDISSDKLDPEFSISCTGKAGEENKGRDGGSHPFWKCRPGA